MVGKSIQESLQRSNAPNYQGIVQVQNPPHNININTPKASSMPIQATIPGTGQLNNAIQAQIPMQATPQTMQSNGQATILRPMQVPMQAPMQVPMQSAMQASVQGTMQGSMQVGTPAITRPGLQIPIQTPVPPQKSPAQKSLVLSLPSTGSQPILVPMQTVGRTNMNKTMVIPVQNTVQDTKTPVTITKVEAPDIVEIPQEASNLVSPSISNPGPKIQKVFVPNAEEQQPLVMTGSNPSNPQVFNAQGTKSNEPLTFVLQGQGNTDQGQIMTIPEGVPVANDGTLILSDDVTEPVAMGQNEAEEIISDPIEEDLSKMFKLPEIKPGNVCHKSRQLSG